MQKNKLAMCKRIFKDFQAKKLVDDKNFLVIDWKNKNGSGEYSIRYTLDIEKGMASYPDLIDIYTKYYSDWWDSGFSTLGRRISDRIYLWAAGFQMAWKQLSENINK